MGLRKLFLPPSTHSKYNLDGLTSFTKKTLTQTTKKSKAQINKKKALNNFIRSELIRSLNQQFNFNHVNFKEKIFLRKIMQIPVKQRESVCDFALFDTLMTLLPFLLHQWDCVSNLSNSSFYLCFLFCMFVFSFSFFFFFFFFAELLCLSFRVV